MHTDGGAVGTAVPLAVWERRLIELRKIGVNAIRTAHNPPAPEFLDLADRMGFLVMDEMFDCWTVAKNAYDYHLYFKDWYVRDTTDTVMRDRNHPSIILWSAGNEIHDTPHPEVAIPILKTLVATFHQNDPTRPVTQALFRPNASHDYDDGLADLLDVIGQNYREQEILAAHAQKPTRKIIGTENTTRPQPVGRHARPSGVLRPVPVVRHRLPGRVAHLADHRLRLRACCSSTALPHGGAFERQSWWSTTPMVAIVRRIAVGASRTRRSRATPMPPASISLRHRSSTPGGWRAAVAGCSGAAGAGAARGRSDPYGALLAEPLLADWTPKDLGPHTENVEVYTNAEEVELFLNGKSLGTREAPPRCQRHHLQGAVRAGHAEGGRTQRRQDRCHRGAEDRGQTGADRSSPRISRTRR